MKNDEYDTRFVDYNGNIVIRTDLNGTVRIYCLNNQYHERKKAGA